MRTERCVQCRTAAPGHVEECPVIVRIRRDAQRRITALETRDPGPRAWSAEYWFASDGDVL